MGVLFSWLTPNEKLFYQRLAIEGNMFALKLALDANVQLADMLRNMKQHYGSVEEVLTKSDHELI